MNCSRVARTLRDRDFAGAEAFVRFLAAHRENSGTTVPLADLESAHDITTDPTYRDRLVAALQRLHPQEYPPAVAPSGGGGSSDASSTPVWAGPSVADTSSNAQWAVQHSYLSRQTSAY